METYEVNIRSAYHSRAAIIEQTCFHDTKEETAYNQYLRLYIIKLWFCNMILLPLGPARFGPQFFIKAINVSGITLRHFCVSGRTKRKKSRLLMNHHWQLC
jgi:hypothetical protein